jgi:hypothetical protein
LAVEKLKHPKGTPTLKQIFCLCGAESEMHKAGQFMEKEKDDLLDFNWAMDT